MDIFLPDQQFASSVGQSVTQSQGAENAFGQLSSTES